MAFHCLHKALKQGRLSAIAKGAILTIGALTALEINNRAAAIVVTGNPNDYIVKPGTGYDGVLRLDIDTKAVGVFTCSGSLLPTGLHILTAAHCVSGEVVVLNNDVVLDFTVNNAKGFFDLPGGMVDYAKAG